MARSPEESLKATLGRVAPGTPLRDGLERILRGRTGALIVLGSDRTIESICSGGFDIGIDFSPTRLRELAKMDGAIICDKDAGNILRAAVAAFAYGRRETVVDTNIRRVHARLISGVALPSPALTAAEMRLAASLLPADDGTSVRWNAAVMELGALVCTARAPKCEACPVMDACAWRGAGEPPPSYIPKGQAWHGTDRQVRGAVLAVLRLAETPVPPEMLQRAPADLGFAPEGVGVPLAALHRLNPAPEQLERSLAGLLADGLAELHDGGFRLPG